MDYTFSPIGVVRSCFSEKFGVPRQSGLATMARGTIDMYPQYGCSEAFRGLEGFSHIWVVFVFDQLTPINWKATVRPPRLGGNKRVGVFASRSPYRPNALGLSVVALDNVDVADNRVILHISGLDLVDGTPVLDIKPYLSYADIVPETRDGFTSEKVPQTLRVNFTASAREQCERLSHTYPHLHTLICQVLSLDPRPAYSRSEDGKMYGICLYNINIRWYVKNRRVEVVALQCSTSTPSGRLP